MSEESKLLNFYSDSLSDRFRKLVQPLEDYFDLNGFFYTVTTSQGYGFQFSNQPELAHYYFTNKLYKTNPWIRHPDNYQHHQIISSSDYTNEFIFQEDSKSIKETKDLFGFENYMAFHKKEKELAHVFIFSSNKKDCLVNTVFLNNRHALIRFGDYFLTEWSQHAQKMENYLINLGGLIGPDFFIINPKLQKDKFKENIEGFMRKIELLGDFVNIKFSPREIECIAHFIKGNSARQIGEGLGLQTRTVEHYLDNIKIKLNCTSKNEALEVLQELKGFNLI